LAFELSAKEIRSENREKLDVNDDPSLGTKRTMLTRKVRDVDRYVVSTPLAQEHATIVGRNPPNNKTKKNVAI